jgi:hypothetical protein
MNDLERYKNFGFDKVEGWCNPQLFLTIDSLNNSEINKRGGALEIGVHHGKFFILLNQVVDKKYSSFAVDIFENQSLNIDHSGHGSLALFKKNLLEYDKHKGSNVVFIEGDSTDPSSNIIEKVGKGSLRFISIDGGHTVAHTINDLKISELLINNEGVVILDDINNYHWPGVIHGALKYLESYPTLVPFAIGANKLYLCKLSFYNFYYQLFFKLPFKTRVVNFSNHLIVAL